MPRDPDLRGFPGRRWHDRNRLDQRAQRLGNAVVAFRQISADDFRQPIEVPQIVIDRRRVQRNDLRRFADCREFGLGPIPSATKLGYAVADVFRRQRARRKGVNNAI